MLARQALDALWAIEVAPLGPQDRHRITLASDGLLQFRDTHNQRLGRIFLLVDHESERNNAAYENKIEYTHYFLDPNTQY